MLMGVCTLFACDFSLAKNNDNSTSQIINKSLDSSDTILGEAVKGTGNVIKATRKTVKNVGDSISKSVENNE